MGCFSGPKSLAYLRSRLVSGGSGALRPELIFGKIRFPILRLILFLQVSKITKRSS